MSIYGPLLVMTHSANVNISGDTAQPFDTDLVNTVGTAMHNPASGNTTVTVPMDGCYDLLFNPEFTSNATGYRLCWFNHGALGDIGGDDKNAVNGSGTRLHAAVMGLPLGVGDTLQFYLRSSQAGLQSITSAHAPLAVVRWVRPLP